MVESIPEKDQFLIAYPNYVLRETVTYPNGGVSRFYDDGVDMVIIDDEICSCREGEQIFPYTLITDKQNHYMKIYRRVFRFLGFDAETIEKCLQKGRQEVLHFTKKISERGEHADSSPLELLFEQNFTDVYGMRALKYLQKEFRISDEDGNNYFLDYLIDTADSRVAIEENGIHYHHPQLIGIEGYRKQLRKQNTCALWGLKLYRFSKTVEELRLEYPNEDLSILLKKRDNEWIDSAKGQLKRNRFAWRYVRDYFSPREEMGRIVIPVMDEEPFPILSAIRSMLSKYGFTEKKTESSEKILLDFYEEERKFDEFSQKALRIRNNECDKVEFEKFTNSIACHLPARSLYPLQLLSAYHMAFSQNACNFSVPGAGKTSIVYGAYAYLHSLPNDNAKHIDKLLVVGPLSSFGPWELEYEECFGHKPSVKRLISGISKTDKQDYLISSRTSELTLISYASLISLQKELGFFLRNNKVMVVLDEAHKAKNSSGGVIAQAVLELAKYSSARVVLTGTPAPNGYEDIYNMFKFIWPTKNIIGFEINQLRDITAMGDRARIERLISNISPFFIRIRKSDLNIPPATINPPIVVPMGEYQRRIYDFIEKKYMDEMIGEGEPDLSSKFKIALAHARMIRLMQAASDPVMLRTPLNEFLEDDECPLEAYQAIHDADVLKAIIEYEAIEIPSKFLAVEKIVRQIIEDGGKVVIWATFIHTIHSIKEYLESKGIQCQELYGAIPVEKEGTIDDGEEQILTREKIVRAFQDDNCPFKVIIANPFAVAESISLHKACHNAIYLERSFNAAHFVQSKDRIHRYGLKEGTKTNYYYILSEDSIDETIDARLAEKEHRMNEIMESMPIPLFDNASDDLGDEDIKALIKDYVRRTKKN